MQRLVGVGQRDRCAAARVGQVAELVIPCDIPAWHVAVSFYCNAAACCSAGRACSLLPEELEHHVLALVGQHKAQRA